MAIKWLLLYLYLYFLYFYTYTFYTYTFTLILIDQCLAQSSSVNILPVVSENKYRNAQPDNVQKVRTLSLNRTSPSNSFPQGSGNFGKVGRKIVRTVGMEDPKETGMTGLMHIWAHNICESIPSIHTSKSEGIPALRRDTDTNPHLFPEAFSNWQPFKKENFIFSRGVVLGIHITGKGRPHA